MSKSVSAPVPGSSTPQEYYATNKNNEYRNSFTQENEMTNNKDTPLKMFRDTKRRFLQQVMVKMGKAQETEDSEYRQLKKRNRELYKQIKVTIIHMKNYMNSLALLGHASSLIGEDSVKLKEKPKEKNQPTYTKVETVFSKSMNQVESIAKDIVGNEMLAIIESFQKKLDELDELKKSMEEREKLKIDYDSAVRKLRMVKEKGHIADISRREIKLRTAEEALSAITGEVIRRLEYYETRRSSFIDEEIERFRQAQAQFFTFCNVAFRSENKPKKLDDEELSQDDEDAEPELSSPRASSKSLQK